MIQNRRSFFSLIVAAVGSFVLIISTLSFAAACDSTMELANGMQAPMRCSYTAKACVLVAGLLLAAIAEAMIRKQNIGGALAAFGVLLLLLPSRFGIGICQGAEMACHTTALWIQAPAGIILLSGISCLMPQKANTVD